MSRGQLSIIRPVMFAYGLLLKTSLLLYDGHKKSFQPNPGFSPLSRQNRLVSVP